LVGFLPPFFPPGLPAPRAPMAGARKKVRLDSPFPPFFPSPPPITRRPVEGWMKSGISGWNGNPFSFLLRSSPPLPAGADNDLWCGSFFFSPLFFFSLSCFHSLKNFPRHRLRDRKILARWRSSFFPFLPFPFASRHSFSRPHHSRKWLRIEVRIEVFLPFLPPFVLLCFVLSLFSSICHRERCDRWYCFPFPFPFPPFPSHLSSLW